MNDIAQISDKHKKFAKEFVRLWRHFKSLNVVSPRVGRMAALMVGYGEGSWSSQNTILAADMAACRLLRRPEVLDYIRELGLVRHGRRWEDIQSSSVSCEKSQSLA
jgi:hypothetical protein